MERRPALPKKALWFLLLPSTTTDGPADTKSAAAARTQLLRFAVILQFYHLLAFLLGGRKLKADLGLLDCQRALRTLLDGYLFSIPAGVRCGVTNVRMASTWS